MRDTIDHGLSYEKIKGSKELIGFSDADWGGDTEDFKSTFGYCFEIGGTQRSRNKPVWRLSTAEAEYMVLQLKRWFG